MKNKMPGRKQSKQSGFTLVEIIVVVAIIGLMGAIIGPTVFNKIGTAKQTRVAQDIRSIDAALKFYRLDNFSYPSQSEGLQALVTAPSSASNWNGPYLDQVPTDPWNQEYRYAIPGANGLEAEVFTFGRDNAEGGEKEDADWGSWNIN